MPDLLFELGCEELPAKDVRTAAKALASALAAALADAGIAAQSVTPAWTPRRLTAFASGLPERSADREERVKGPRLSAAFDAAGAPTRAADGFARKSGVAPQDLLKEGEFVVAVVRTAGRPSAAIVGEILPGLVAKIPWRKSMRWGAPLPFARPIRSVAAILGSEIVPCVVNGVPAGRSVTGHPFLSPGTFDLPNADRRGYVDLLRRNFVLADPDERSSTVCAAARNAIPEVEIDADLLEEVTNLVEWPSALLGRFGDAYLRLPPRLLTTVMAHHQRFFPVRGPGGQLMNSFVAILDRGVESVEPSRRGFERVLVPRLHDAVFFFDEDRKRPLESRLDRLRTVTYHKALGTTLDKAKRLEALAPWICERLGGGAEEQALAARAGLLAKCDLVTQLVGEFPELQGHVGSVYARLDGEDAAVAAALDLQYRHEFAIDAAAPPRAALSLLLAEHLDVVAQFGAKVSLPTGSSDPFGVRRAGIAVLEVCERWAPGLDVGEAVRRAGGNDEVIQFLDARLRQRAKDRGARAEFVAAVPAWRSVGEFRHVLSVLLDLSKDPGFPQLAEVAERCANITAKAGTVSGELAPHLFTEPAERDLAAAWEQVRGEIPSEGLLDARHGLAISAALAKPLHRFFEEVFVNADDADVRRNRLLLLTQVSAALRRLGDLSRVARL